MITMIRNIAILFLLCTVISQSQNQPTNEGNRENDKAKSESLLDPIAQGSSGCGYRNPDGIGFRITGAEGYETNFGEFPWMVAIVQKEQIENKDFISAVKCGGSLIHPSVVLTAAHCVEGKDLKSFTIRAGEWDIQTTAEIYPHQDRNIADIVLHENFNKSSNSNDIALIFLSEPFKLEENVKTICLPPANLNFDLTRCYVTGWGKDIILQKVDLPVVPREECQKQLQQTRLKSNFELHQSFICAGSESGKDGCKADAGSPLVCPIQGAGKAEKYYQAGISSWGIGCDSSIPAVYVSVAELRPWIDEQLTRKQIDHASFTP